MMIARGGKSQETGEKKIPELMEDIKIPTDKKKKIVINLYPMSSFIEKFR